MSKSLFDKYGGFETIGTLVHEFYKKVLANPKLTGYFKNTVMDKVMEHQTNFLGAALGGPNKYEGKELKSAHEELNITDDHFDLVAGYLEETLDEAGVEEKDIEAIIKIVAETKDQIIGKLAAS